MPLNIDEFLQNPTAIEFNSFKKAELRNSVNSDSYKRKIEELKLNLELKKF